MVTFWKDLKLRERIDRLLLRRKNSPKVNGTAIEPAASGTTAKREKSGGELSHPKSSGMSNRLDSDKHEIQVWEVKEPWLDLKCTLGEGPYYEEDTHQVRFTDIFGKKIYWVDVDKGPSSLRSIEIPDFVGVTADIESHPDKMIVGAKYGYAIVDKTTGSFSYIQKSWDDRKDGAGKLERMRFNDGAVDPRGRFWAGSMTDNSIHKVEAEGALFLLESLSSPPDLSSLTENSNSNPSPSPKLKLTRPISPVSIPNGIGWARDGRTMFFTDSPTRTIWAFDYDLATGGASNRRPWFKLEGSIRIPKSTTSTTSTTTRQSAAFEEFTFNDSMVPDGFQLDADGNLWSAVWGAGMVIRIKDLGERRVVTGVVRIPARCSTCPRFVRGGGMVVTSASEEEPEVYGDGGPGAGGVFWVDVGVEGCETFRFGRGGGE